MSGTAAFECKQGDLLDAYRLHQCGVSGRALVLLIGYVLLASLAVAWMDGRGGMADLGFTFVGLLGTVIIVVCILKALLGAVYLPHHARKIFAQQKTLHGPVNLEWDDAGMAVSNASGNARIAWSDCHAFSQSDAVILLYLSDALYYFFPARSFSSMAPRDDFLSTIVQARVQQRTGRILCMLERKV